jgi:hypothetical protein
MIQYIIVHCKHIGCYDHGYYEEKKVGNRMKPIVTINPPKIFLFDNKAQAKEFFDEYINDVDVLDERCVNGEHINHVDYCNCGIVELDEEDGQPIFFYNHRNQIYLLETGPQLFVTPHNLKIDLNNMNLTNSLIKKSKYLGREQKLRYIELGNRCQEYMKKPKYIEEENNEEVNDEQEQEKEEAVCQPCTTNNSEQQNVKEEEQNVKEEQNNVKEEQQNIKEEQNNVDGKGKKEKVKKERVKKEKVKKEK